MVVGIIGAGLSGLTAGRVLAKAGHEVTIFEKNRGFGGRMATRSASENSTPALDYGASYFEVVSDEFREFAHELLDKKLIQTWGRFAVYDGERLLKASPGDSSKACYTSTRGMSEIARYMSRWVDIQTDTKVGGLTYFGTNRSRKRSWMMNLTSSKTFEADAVIIALPAPQAYGILSTTIDETNVLKIVRQIDEVRYSPAYSLMVDYESVKTPQWQGINCKNGSLGFISNEALKRGSGECSLVVHASASFTKQHNNSGQDIVAQKMLAELVEITGSWAASPERRQLHFWPYSHAQKIINTPFLELEDEDAPLALVGDYLEGNTMDHAYRSGHLLAEKWNDRF